MGGNPAEDSSSIAVDRPDPYLASPLDLAWQQGKQRQAAAMAKQQQDVAAGVAAELNLVLRGKPYSKSVLHYATGHYAAVRDVLLAHEGKQARRQAWQTWLEGYRETEDFQTVWAVAKTITDSRDAHRQAVREAALLRKAQQAAARSRDFFQKAQRRAAGLGTADDSDDLPTIPRPDPQVFLTTLKTFHEGGRADEYVYLAPMTRARSDPAGLAKSARRYAKQLEWEQTEGGRRLCQLVLSDEDWKRQAAAWRQQKKRTGQDVAWQVYRDPDGGRVTVFHDSPAAGGAAVAADPAVLYGLVHSLLSQMVTEGSGARVRTSAGFGGAFQGSRGDGQARQAKRQGRAGQWELVGQFVTEGPGIQQAAALLGIDLSPKLRGRAQVSHEDALLALLEGGFIMRPRKAHAAALSVFDVLLPQAGPDEALTEDAAGDMSHLVYRGIESSSCTVSVTEDPIDEAWPAPTDQPERQPQPVYLWGDGPTW
jgi:hypothetical protein